MIDRAEGGKQGRDIIVAVDIEAPRLEGHEDLRVGSQVDLIYRQRQRLG